MSRRSSASSSAKSEHRPDSGAETPATYSVLGLLSSQIDRLPPGEARVVNAILDQPYAALNWSANELAEQAETSAATAVRACRRMGIDDGLPGLRIALARELGWNRLDADVPLGEPEALAKAVLVATSTGLANIAEHVDLVAFGHAVEAVASARRLLFVCSGPTQVVCQDASFDFASIGRPAEYIADSVTQTLNASLLRAGDVCFAAGVSGSNELTITAARAAKDAKATLIVITSYPQSSLARMADVKLIVGGSRVPEPMRATVSQVGMLVLLRALSKAVAQLQGGAEGPLMSVHKAHRRIGDDAKRAR